MQLPTHMLLVENDANTRMILRRLFEKDGYRVMTAHDGETALSLLEHYSFDVVLTDMHLGQIGGVEVLEAARRQKSSPVTLVMTGDWSLETAIAAMRAGTYDYLLKPCRPSVLMERIQVALMHRLSEMALA
jgi:DNA-binding response OmpR family regulator